MKKAEKSFISGALILSLGGLFAKILGALYRIPLTNIIGSYGMGLYQLVFPPYILFLTIAQAGIPVAVSKLIAENNQLGKFDESRKVFRYSFAVLASLGLVSVALMASLSKVIARSQGNAETATAFLIVAPALLFVPITNALKAYFQGNMN
ncbi:MAG: oligosaccharide flippase family protein, partial [Clostridia bacterium]|nr:oligosaccharide flippase family protein [Clostridia bacterium]